ncbi:MAG: TolC family protein [Elusimicrobia bacterium]|nr:TolC family protein [Elusimicrobiota bacterium]
MRRSSGFFFLVFTAVMISSLVRAEEVRSLPLGLEDVSRLAVQNSLAIQIAEYDARIAKAGAKGARSLFDAYLTADVNIRENGKARTSTVYGTDSQENNYDVGLSKKLPSGTSVDVDATNARDWTNLPTLTHETTLGVTIEQEMGRNFFGRADRLLVRIADIQSEIAGFFSWRKIEAELALVQKAYWTLVFERARSGVEEEMVRQSEALYKAQKEKRTTGLSEDGDVLAAEANHLARLNESALAKENETSAQTNLSYLLNLDANAPVIIPAETLSLDDAAWNETEILQAAFQMRQDYQALLKDVEALGLVLVKSRDAMLPTIDLKASFFRNGLGDHFKKAWDETASDTQEEFFLGLSVKVPIENTAARSEKEKAELEKAQAILRLKQMERLIILEVHDQVRACRVYQEVARSAQKTADLQAEKLATEEKKFSYGRSSIDTIIRYQDDVLGSRLSAAGAVLRYRSALVDLALTEGGLLEKYYEAGEPFSQKRGGGP